MITVIKANRTKEPFSEDKVMNSIRRARIPKSLHQDVLDHVKSKLYEGISTEEIYQHIIEFLERAPNPYIESRYSLKGAIMQLGPTGYPFEDFVSRLFEAQGYSTQVRQTLNGKCVTHEVDVVAEKEGEALMIEVKFHNSHGTRSEIQTALYTQARFEDVKVKNNVTEAWLVTNTKTTVDANTYAQCCGMKVMSWDYPTGNSLRELIEKTKLHPITMLTTLSSDQKASLLESHVILCREILEDPTVLDRLYLSKADHQKVLEETQIIVAEEE